LSLRNSAASAVVKNRDRFVLAIPYSGTSAGTLTTSEGDWAIWAIQACSVRADGPR
jgi:hypothetical protein